ncbi:hypothetical protein [Amycolatopsis jejuensis]|uniref:hypothetical protein n=1 Tax=Amycolatopsis jejuensis TaxID=330084 RepID=UPI00068AEEC4|nr:hypothetical protein [Amycolatopsis jejuensis]
MTTTATLMTDLSRVRIAFDGFAAAVDSAIVERSLDGARWVTVRGGSAVPVVAGAGHLDDFEFTPGVVNYYRVSGVDSAPISMVAAPGATVTGNNASLSPALPAGGAGGLTDGDTLFLFASIRNSGAGAPVKPAGWTTAVDMGNAVLFTRRYTTGVAAPTVAFTGGVANADTGAQVTAFHNADLTPVVANPVLNASAQNVALPSLTVPEQQMLNLWLGWKQDDWTGASSGRGFAEIGDWSSTAGDDAAMWWEYTVQGSTDIDIGAGTLTVTGGAAAISRAAALAFRKAPWLFQQTASITPSLADASGVDKVWIKNLRASYLNTALDVPVGYITIGRKARAGVFEIVGRDVPVAVTDKRQGKTYTLGALLDDDTDYLRLDAVLSAGDTILLHVPPHYTRLPSMYAVIGDISYDDEAKTLWMPLTQVAAPSASVVGATVTWADIKATYATWADLLAAKATWADVLDSVGDPTNIITE